MNRYHKVADCSENESRYLFDQQHGIDVRWSKSDLQIEFWADLTHDIRHRIGYTIKNGVKEYFITRSEREGYLNDAPDRFNEEQFAEKYLNFQQNVLEFMPHLEFPNELEGFLAW